MIQVFWMGDDKSLRRDKELSEIKRKRITTSANVTYLLTYRRTQPFIVKDDKERSEITSEQPHFEQG